MTDGDTTLADKANLHMNVGFGEVLGLKYTEITSDHVAAEFTITPTLHQPYGIVHGGVYCAVIETLASIGASYWHGSRGSVVGVNNNTDFLRAVREGTLFGEARPIHRGRLQQLWEVTITDDSDRLIARGQVRLANLDHPPAEKSPEVNGAEVADAVAAAGAENVLDDTEQFDVLRDIAEDAESDA